MDNKWVLVGILISFFFSELTGLSPGGVIVPIYLALNLNEPRRVAGTLLISCMTFLLLKLAEKWLILYGRRKFVLAVCFSMGLTALINALPGTGLYFSIIGYLIPGILAREMDRQGILKTAAALTIVVAVLAMLLMWVGML